VKFRKIVIHRVPKYYKRYVLVNKSKHTTTSVFLGFLYWY